MRHRLSYNHLSRPTAHRMSMLRNLVSSLLEHEQITTTLAKAKETQRLADKVIGWGKQGGHNNWTRANAFLKNQPRILEPLFTTLSQRYASRPGGYTRLLRSGHRVGDHAELAVLELVDNKNDLRYEQVSKTLARELAMRAFRKKDSGGSELWWDFRDGLEKDGEAGIVNNLERVEGVEELTKKNIVKALSFRPSFASISTEGSSAEQEIHPATQFLNRTHHHYLSTLAELHLSSSIKYQPDPSRTVKQLESRLHPSDERGAPKPVLTVPMTGKRPNAGEQWIDQELESEFDRLNLKGGPISRAKAGRSRHARRSGLFDSTRVEQ